MTGMGSLLRDLWDVFAWLCLCEDPPADESNNVTLIQNQNKGVPPSTSNSKVREASQARDELSDQCLIIHHGITEPFHLHAHTL